MTPHSSAADDVFLLHERKFLDSLLVKNIEIQVEGK